MRLLRDPHLPRRQFIRTAGGLFLAIAAPLGAACTGDAETDAGLIRLGVALLVSAVEYSLEDEVTGDVVFQNPESKRTSFRSNYNLLEAFANGREADENVYDYDIDPGEHMFGWGGLFARSVGDHLVRLLIPGAEYQTDTFGIG